MINKNKIIAILLITFLNINIVIAWYNYTKTVQDIDWNNVLLEAPLPGRIASL